MNRFKQWVEEKQDAQYWGYHLVLDLADCNENIFDEKKIKEFLKELVHRIDMTAVGPPVVKYLLAGKPNAGFSAMQLIETSSITCHFIEPNKTAYIDVFSCKEFKPQDAEDVIKECFNAKVVHKHFLKRDATQP